MLSGACSCWRIQVAVTEAAWVRAWCWVWLDWGGRFEGVVGAGDDVEGGAGGGCRTGGVVRHGPPKTSARPIRRAQGRLTTNGLRGEVFDYGLEFGEVGEFVVAVALDEEHGDGLRKE